jgi:flagellar hook-associated protein 1 FlgK
VADNLASEFRLRDSKLVDHQNQTNTDMLDLVAQVNEITERIDAFNRRISATPTPAQNLIDDRNNEIKQLSELVGVEVFQLDNNMVQVNLKGPNVILVGREIRNELGTEVNTSTGFYDITHVTKGNSTVVTNDMVSGKLAAKIQLRDVGLQGVRDKLDTLAGSMIVEMSSIHDNGFDLNGNTNLRFFDPPLVTVLGATPVGTVDPDRYRGMAGTISLSTQLIDPADPNGGYDPTRVALSATGSAGDNGIALQMADLQHSVGLIDLDRDGDPSNDNSETFQKFFNTTMGEVGRTVRNANDGLDTQIALLEQAEVRREQVSGVSLDEEAVHLSQFQRAFEASSRFLNVINQLTAEIINRLG